MEHICENCRKSYKEKDDYFGFFQLRCEDGNEAFYECQVACTDDYFEPKKRG